MVQGMTWRTQLSSWNQRPFWSHTSEHKARISSKTGPKHVWCLCIKAVPVRWNLPFLEDSHPAWPFLPLFLCNSSSVNPCAHLPLHALLPALTKCQLRHKFLTHTWAILSDNPPGLLHPPTSLLQQWEPQLRSHSSWRHLPAHHDMAREVEREQRCKAGRRLRL